MKLQNHAYPRRFAVLGAVFAAALFGSVLLGRFSVTPKELFRLLLSRLTETEPGWRDGAENVVFQIRLPRVAAAALIGAALAAAGVSYQGMFRNPMVSPDILGASTGAGFGAALAILLGAGYFGISASAFVSWPAGGRGGLCRQLHEPHEPDYCPHSGRHDGLVALFGGHVLSQARRRYAAAAPGHYLLADGKPILHQAAGCAVPCTRSRLGSCRC